MSRRKVRVENLTVGMLLDMGVAGILCVTAVRRRGDYVTVTVAGSKPETYQAGSSFEVVGK
jgi:hypothetical protein